MFGYTPEEWQWTSSFWMDADPPGRHDRHARGNDEANRTGEPFRAEYRLRAADGRWVWVARRGRRACWTRTGSPMFWQGVLVDITGQKQAEQDLREAEARYRVLVEHIPAVVYTESPDADPAKFYISPQVEELFGYTAARMDLDPGLLDRPHPPRRPGGNARARRGGQSDARAPTPVEYRFRRPTAIGYGCTTRRRSSPSRTARASGRGSCSTSPSARKPRSSSGRRS